MCVCVCFFFGGGGGISSGAYKQQFRVFMQHSLNLLRYAEDAWLWELDWSVQEIRTKKLKQPKKKRQSKAEKNTTNVIRAVEETSGLFSEDELIDDNNVEVVEGLKSSTDMIATVPPAVDVMYKRRQNLPGYPK